MTVPKYKRTLSDMEFFHKALELRKAITLILLKNFNIHDKVRRFGLFERMNNISEDDRKKLEEILSKYQIIDILERYPQWFIDDCRKTVSHLTLKRHRRKIVKLLSLYKTKKSEITLGDIVNIHKGCMGSYKHYDSYTASMNMERYFRNNFNKTLGVSYGRK